MKDAIEAIKNSVENLNRMKGAEGRISGLEDISCYNRETIKQLEAELGQAKKIFKNEETLLKGQI